MAHCYASTDKFKAFLVSNGVTDFGSTDDDAMLTVLEASSRRIDGYCRRSRFGSGFGPRIGTNRYDTAGGLDLAFDDDLLALTSATVYAGTGGAPEGVLAAAALRCLGGGMQAKIWPRDEAERQSLIQAGWGDKLDMVYRSRELARGNEILFAATGISDSPLLKGVEVHGATAITHSVLMRAKSGTVRYMRTEHNLEKKTIHLRSSAKEVTL